MTAVLRAARAAVSRRRLQTVIVGMVVLLSAATGVLAIGLLVVSHAPFDSAFRAAQGAHVTATMKAGTPSAALAATATAPGVTAAAGPFAQVTAVMSVGSGLVLGSADIVGRSTPTGAVDRLGIDKGSWLDGPGQVVLSRAYAGPLTDQIGTDITVNLPGRPTLRLVGIADSVTGTADAWVWPAQDSVLHAAGAPTAEQMLYRFAANGTGSALRSDLEAVTAALPAGSVTGASTYLAVRQAADRTTSAFVPFVVAFAILGLVLAVLITGNVVNGAVVAGYRTIGILKTLGFTPRQVVAVYVVQVLAPALVGSVAGVALGVGLATPLLFQTDQAYDVAAATRGVPVWVMAMALVGAPLLVVLAAVGPAARAGRLAPNQAISVGRAPRTGRGFRARRALTASPLPRPVALGLGMPLARPARAAGTVVAILLGAATLVFAVGLSGSLHRVRAAFTRVDAVPVVVQLPTSSADVTTGGPVLVTPSPVTARVDPATVLTTTAAQPGTRHSVQEADVPARVAGFNHDVTIEAYAGDATWTGHAMIAGRWYTGSDQVVASSYLLRQSGHQVGDTLTLVGDAGQRTVTVVGSFLDGGDNFDLIAAASTAAGLSAQQGPTQIEVGLTPGTDPAGYARALQSKFPIDTGVFIDDRTQDINERTFAILDALIGTLTLLLCAVAALGVLNTVVLNTRERIHDIGVFKSLGMTPGQVRAMVITSMIGLGAIAGAIAIPCGVALHDRILPDMGDAAGTDLPQSIIQVYGAWQLVALGATGIALAVVGALLPAGWAARTRVANALRTE